ncbi:hypothetical protein M0R04_02790 [Candidatus Dojkabacteria bacterium]|jgi:hypothetical protein|nr:hypothetical protein [Candidatus Dojkabacteria bacterium]
MANKSVPDPFNGSRNGIIVFMTGISIYSGISILDSYLSKISNTDRQMRWAQPGASYIGNFILSSIVDTYGRTSIRFEPVFSFPDGSLKTQTILVRNGGTIEPVGSSKYNLYTYDDLELDNGLTSARHNFNNQRIFNNFVAGVTSVDLSLFDFKSWTGCTTYATSKQF